MSESERFLYRSCRIHKKERFPFYRKCWKCQILEIAKNFREIRIVLKGRKIL